MTPEGKVKQQLRRIFETHGVLYTMPVTGGYGKNGVLDYICCHRGRYFEVEAKAGSALTALQGLRMRTVQDAGGKAFVVRGAGNGLDGLDELLTFLESGK
jgi:hypothetical protein